MLLSLEIYTTLKFTLALEIHTLWNFTPYPQAKSDFYTTLEILHYFAARPTGRPGWTATRNVQLSAGGLTGIL